MEMDALDDFSDRLIVIKGHRTKRPRPPSPVSLAVTMCSDDDDDDRSNETGESTVEDEIMANCLIYLAQSGGCCIREEQVKLAKSGGCCIREEQVKLAKKRFNEVVISDSRTEIKETGLFVYECKTCNRNFPSFQALGGHRASHKRPKIMLQGDKKAIFTTSTQNLEEEEEEIGGKLKRLSDDNIIVSPEFRIKLAQKTKIHECSYCGSEFSSGQALGGHMRRHRNSSNAKVNNNSNNTNIAVGTEKKKHPRRVFQLDLNLPAPEVDDHRDLKFQFEATAASALVDCHY